MGLITKIVEVNLTKRNIRYYRKMNYVKVEERHYENKNINVKVEDLPQYSEQYVMIKCDNCGKEYEKMYYGYLKNVKQDGNTYCHKCSCKIFNGGETNLNWNPNKTDKDREIGRSYPEYKEFIKKVLTRDEYICQCCGKHRKQMEVHHLDGYDWCNEKRIDETNGIALCYNCHKNFHSRYGRGNNTKQQFEEWFGHAIYGLNIYNGELPTTRKVYCIEENKVYNGALELADEWNLKNSSVVYNVCNHLDKYITVKEKHLLWYDEYLKMKQEDVDIYLKNNIGGRGKYQFKKIICTTTNEIFEGIKYAKDKYKVKNINKCLKHERNFCGKLEDGTKLQWEYYDMYMNESIKDKLSERLGKKIYATSNVFQEVKQAIFKEFSVIKWEDVQVQNYNRVYAFVDELIEQKYGKAC